MNTPSEPITEQDLPGIGRRYQLNDDAGHIVTIIVHHSGRRDLYLVGAGGGEPHAASFTDDQARRLGAILAGVYFKPAAVAQVEAVIGGLLIDWVTLHERSPARRPLHRRPRGPPGDAHDDRGDRAGRLVDRRAGSGDSARGRRPSRGHRPSRGSVDLPRGGGDLMENSLIALGGAFLAAGPARAGRSTHRAADDPSVHGCRASSSVRTPRALPSSTIPRTSSCSPTLGLVLLLFHLGLEFSLDDLAAGGRRLAIAGRHLPRAQPDRRSCVWLRGGMGHRAKPSSSREPWASLRRRS